MKVIAFYLPQFHETEENNTWWGKGFTEWNNMQKATPLIENQYQPRIPLNNNYYDLSKKENLIWQTKLAKKYNIDGFCCYHYWFNGKLLLNKPMETYLDTKECDLPFCFCWANETWTNAWSTGKSSERKVLIKQEYGGIEEWEKHFKYLLKFFNDSRYMKIDNKPILVIYKPQQIDNLNNRLDYYNKRAQDEGFNGIVFMAQHVSFYDNKKVDKSRISYQIEYQPNFAFYDSKTKFQKLKEKFVDSIKGFVKKHLKSYKSISNPTLKIDSYENVWKKILERKPENNMIPGAFVDWDNTPRYGNRGKVLLNSSPANFEKYFKMQYKRAIEEYKSDYLFIFAWNEWSEGGYLEPDEKYKYGYLETIKRVVSGYKGGDDHK